MMLARLIAPLALATPALAAAQGGLGIPLLPHAYVGVEAGQGTRGTTAVAATGTLDDRHDKALDYGAFVGVELPTLPFGYFAIEGNVGKSDAKTFAVSGTGATTTVANGKADWNWSATARAGINAIPGLAAYGLAGYGAEKVEMRYTNLNGRPIGDDTVTRDGLIYGAGVRYTFGRFLGARVEYRKRLTSGRYDPEQVMGGVYFRL